MNGIDAGTARQQNGNFSIKLHIRNSFHWYIVVWNWTDEKDVIHFQVVLWSHTLNFFGVAMYGRSLVQMIIKRILQKKTKKTKTLFSFEIGRMHEIRRFCFSCSFVSFTVILTIVFNIPDSKWNPGTHRLMVGNNLVLVLHRPSYHLTQLIYIRALI